MEDSYQCTWMQWRQQFASTRCPNGGHAHHHERPSLESAHHLHHHKCWVWFFTYFLHNVSSILTFLSSRPMTLHDQIPCFLTFLTYSTIMLLCCILPNNMRLYSFLWLTGRVLKQYFGKLFFLGDGSREQIYEEDRQQILTAEKGRTVHCYTLDVVTGYYYTLDVATGCCYTLDAVTGCCYTMHWYKNPSSHQKQCHQ